MSIASQLLTKHGLYVVCVCVNLFNKGRPIEGRVPSQAPAVAQTAGQAGGQEHHCQQSLHDRWPACFQVVTYPPGGLVRARWPMWPRVGLALAMCAPHEATTSTGGCTHDATAGPVDTWCHSICWPEQLPNIGKWTRPAISESGWDSCFQFCRDSTFPPASMTRLFL